MAGEAVPSFFFKETSAALSFMTFRDILQEDVLHAGVRRNGAVEIQFR